MSTALPAEARPRIGRLFRFQWEPAQQAYVLLYPEGMVKLNQSAGEILRRCDGHCSVAAVVAGVRFLSVTPDGLALRCHTARMLPGFAFPDVRKQDLASIWYESEAFNLFRGTAWLPEPCRSCDEQEKDDGGCRCQAFMLTGDASATDPVCEKSPQHGLIANALQLAAEVRSGRLDQPVVFRDPKTSRQLKRPF